MLVKLKSKHQIFASKGVQAILNYKWEKYGRKIFLRKAIVHFIYLVIFNVNSLFIFENRLIPDINQHYNMTLVSKIFDGILLTYGLYFIYSSIIKFFILGKKNTLNSLWNYIRILNIFLCNTTLIMDMFNCFGFHSYEKELKALHSIALLLSWLYMVGFSRGFEGTAFMIRIMIQVVIDLRFFLLIMILVLFSLSFSGL